jgi:hypothetical protein
MGSQPLPSSVETVGRGLARPAGTVPRQEQVLLVAGLDDPVVADLVTFLSRRGEHKIALISRGEICQRVRAHADWLPPESFPEEFSHRGSDSTISSVVLFLGRKLTRPQRSLIDQLAAAVASKAECRACLVSSSRVHWHDKHAAEIETYALHAFQQFTQNAVVFRPSLILSPNSKARAWLRFLWFCYPLVPKHWTGCSIESEELFTAIEHELTGGSRSRARIYTLLGPNETWRCLLQNHRQAGALQSALAVLTRLLRWTGAAAVAGILFGLCMRLMNRSGRWNLTTLYPRCTQELLALYNKYNFRHVKIVGYNNGVVHFGQRYPGQTIVSTVRCNHVARVHGQEATFDAGVTLRQANETLDRAGKEFYVLPNYSYISVGTGFFIPIHGSASDYSTLAETLERVTLYDPVADRFLVAKRTDPAFHEYLYNLRCDILLLRARFRIRERSVYYRKQETLQNPRSAELLDKLRDKEASNVEIRKGRAGDESVDVTKYYTRQPPGCEALPFPRDALGRLWDKLESNPVSSYLFHALTRRFAHHVELFFTAEEFAVYWRTHQTLPISKLQLRYIKRDGFRHSPFREHDCISADMFMLKKHKPAFEAYLRENFSAVQFNPGKHSS